MWNEILNLAIKNGLWAVLFTGLLIFVIKDSAKREQKYQQTIKDLTSHLGIVKDIKDDVDEIKNFVYKTKKSKNVSKKSSFSAKNTKNEANMKEKFKSYSFWMSVTAAVILVLNNIGNVFGFEVSSDVVTKIVDSICGVLILFGVITMSKDSSNENIETKENIEQEHNLQKTKDECKQDKNKKADKEREE